ncbi:MAG: formamidopyrimidine-DNA glycosylase, partial [Gemmatimonadota bacterium]
MPELPEVTIYIETLERFLPGQPLERVRLRSPSLLKTYTPPLSAVEGRRVLGFSRIGKRIVLELEGEHFLVFHLMLTGRFRWRQRRAEIPKRRGHAALDFPHGTLLLTEEATKKRASLHVVQGRVALESFDRGGLEPLEATLEEFAQALLKENRTLKRALTDPRLLSGIGNAHSDEILLAARLSPIRRTRLLDEDEVALLYDSVRAELREWIDRLRLEAGDAFPEKLTASHPAMKAHGKYGQPCPQCGSPIQRIAYA